MAKKRDRFIKKPAESDATRLSPPCSRKTKSFSIRRAEGVGQNSQKETAPSRIEPEPPCESAGPVSISFEEIQTRAYLISERRRAEFMPGDEFQDWMEAEHQLRYERQAALVQHGMNKNEFS